MAVGFPTKVSYLDGDVFSASDINDTNGTINLLGSSVAYTAGKNALINGGFQIWQRGTSSAGNAYLADRWYSALISGTGTFAQESTVVPSGSTYSQKFTASATAQPALYQAIETSNAIRYAGQTMTVSAKVAASTSVGFTADVQYSTTTDNSVTGTWTSITATSGGTATATSTTFVSISGVYAIPSTAKSLRVRLFTTSTIANTVVVYFGQAQLEQGSTVTAFQTATGTIQNELAACQRYYYRMIPTGGDAFYGTGLSNNTVQCSIVITFPVTMRTKPTALEQSGTAADYRVRQASTTTSCSSVPSLDAAEAFTAFVNFTVASGLTAGQAVVGRAGNSSGYLGWSAEL